jgi:hypothetical protein
MELQMKNSSLLRAAVASIILIGFSAAAHAQSEPQKKNPAQSQKPAAKPHKVWTEDNLSTVRTPADMYIEAQDRQSTTAANANATATASVQTAAEKQPAANSQKPAKTPPLAHAKSADDADFKIEWEKKDIQGQEEYLVRMQNELEQAPPEQKEHIQKLIEQHTQILADTRKELQGLEEQKKDFQKSPAAQSSPSNSQPPSQ